MTPPQKTLTLACFKTDAAPAVPTPARQTHPLVPALKKASAPRKWVQKKLAVTAACDRFTEMEMRLCECTALGSWESR